MNGDDFLDAVEQGQLHKASEQMQALLDVVVAADWMDPDERSKVLNHYLDKLREISDD